MASYSVSRTGLHGDREGEVAEGDERGDGDAGLLGQGVGAAGGQAEGGEHAADAVAQVAAEQQGRDHVRGGDDRVLEAEDEHAVRVVAEQVARDLLDVALAQPHAVREDLVHVVGGGLDHAEREVQEVEHDEREDHHAAAAHEQRGVRGATVAARRGVGVRPGDPVEPGQAHGRGDVQQRGAQQGEPGRPQARGEWHCLRTTGGRRLWVPHDGGIPGARARRLGPREDLDLGSLHNG
jgi:hypothetical protein